MTGMVQPSLKNCVIKVQTTPVASPGFGPIFGLLARIGISFGIGGFESPQPIPPTKIQATRELPPSGRAAIRTRAPAPSSPNVFHLIQIGPVALCLHVVARNEPQRGRVDAI